MIREQNCSNAAVLLLLKKINLWVAGLVQESGHDTHAMTQKKREKSQSEGTDLYEIRSAENGRHLSVKFKLV